MTNPFGDLFGDIFTRPQSATAAPRPREGAELLLARIANAVELSAALKAHEFFRDQRDHPPTGVPNARDAAQRAMDKLAPLVQLRASRMVKGNFDA